MKRIRVNASREYDILIEKGLLEVAGGLIAENTALSPSRRALIVTDDNVDMLYSDRLKKSLSDVGYKNIVKFVFANGEASKSPEVLLELCRVLAREHFTRSDFLIALGGGVVGDLCGFAASIYERGIEFVQIPTTLLSCVDSSVGGKTAVDLPEGKNLIGTFYQPSLVICDPSLLDSLPCDIYRDGYAEVIKYGVILDSEFFDRLSMDDRPDICDVIARSVEIKRDIVSADERDRSLRGLLNFGHTLGHGIELHTAFEYSHGAAVAVGMVLASRIAALLGICEDDIPSRVESLLKRYGFDTSCPINASELFDAALSDKKRNGKRLTLILPKAIGDACFYEVDLTCGKLEHLIEEAIKWKS